MTRLRSKSILLATTPTGHAPWAPRGCDPGGSFFPGVIVNRTVFLVDGFNVHHSLLDAERVLRRPLSRLDVAGLCASYLHVLPGRSATPRVVYFTALAHHLEKRRPGQRARQARYLAGLRATGVDVRLGRFKAKSLTCPLCGRSFVRFEEKETDVALGVQLLEYALRESCDAVVLVSGDSDLVPALVAARRLTSSTTLVVGLPFGRTNAALEQAADVAFTIKPSAYARYQLAVEAR